MIEGYATKDATAAWAHQHYPIASRRLGKTRLTASQAGFGCYRIGNGVAHHRAALQKALCAGINLIDTSTNYTDGGSENLVGEVLESLVKSGEIRREEIVVVSKVGYLQGQNYDISQKRKLQGCPFPDLVDYHEGLEHCIHPEFIADQLGRSLKRLKLRTLDFYLLHNPEYFLEWAQKKGYSSENARAEYYRRIQSAFEYLEGEVSRGRVRRYGISSNTFAEADDQIEFTCLETIWSIAESIAGSHHFRLIQLPLNLMEPGAVLQKNQPGGESVLEFAERKELGVLVNRPLNGFCGNKLVRLAQLPAFERQSKEEITHKLQILTKSEKSLWMKILPSINVPSGLQARIKEQMAIGETLKHHWLNFGSYQGWRHFKTGNFLPRIQGVMDFLKPFGSQNEKITEWMTSHQQRLEEAFKAVASIYAEKAAYQVDRIRRVMAAADMDWAAEGTLSQKALRAVRSTQGVSCVLVGMRREEYVSDVLTELRRPVRQDNRIESWQSMTDGLANAGIC